MTNGPPALVATIGLHGSASTWVFNVARELLAATVGAQQVQGVFAATPTDLPERPARHLVVKSHDGSDALEAWLRSERAVILLSLRDPRDAALSMAERFGTPLMEAAAGIAVDCARIERLAGEAAMVLRYEDRFFEAPAAVAAIASALGCPPDAARDADIFARYATEAVRQFIAGIRDLPPARRLEARWTTMDRETLIHRTHIGDARSGKWRDLPPPLQAALGACFGDVLKRLGYPALEAAAEPRPR